MTTVLLGSTGLLGRAVTGAGEVIVPDRARADLAVASVDDWKAIIREVGATSVLNAAAMARVDRCESQIEAASAVNAVGPGRLALACADAGVPLAHVSTDYVFGDQKRRGPGPYAERARHGPVQSYGATKAQGEKLVLAQGWFTTVARVSWLFGPGGDPFGRFVLGQVASGGDVAVMTSQQSRPTWVPDLARWLLDVCRALESDAAGDTDRAGAPRVPPVLHPTGGPAADRGTWARAVLDARGHADVAVVDQGAPPSTLVAARPLDSRLDGAATAEWCVARGIAPILDWREGVRRIHAP